mmetsp:Transcript_140465/g.448927  ORF Transcript_140465/g.448927 Transcript_140465/m.448927 type:complete len:216 (-) Transcript_140465:741-1388(-)
MRCLAKSARERRMWTFCGPSCGSMPAGFRSWKHFWHTATAERGCLAERGHQTCAGSPMPRAHRSRRGLRAHGALPPAIRPLGAFIPPAKRPCFVAEAPALVEYLRANLPLAVSTLVARITATPSTACGRRPRSTRCASSTRTSSSPSTTSPTRRCATRPRSSAPAWWGFSRCLLGQSAWRPAACLALFAEAFSASAQTGVGDKKNLRNRNLKKKD